MVTCGRRCWAETEATCCCSMWSLLCRSSCRKGPGQYQISYAFTGTNLYSITLSVLPSFLHIHLAPSGTLPSVDNNVLECPRNWSIVHGVQPFTVTFIGSVTNYSRTALRPSLQQHVSEFRCDVNCCYPSWPMLCIISPSIACFCFSWLWCAVCFWCTAASLWPCCGHHVWRVHPCCERPALPSLIHFSSQKLQEIWLINSRKWFTLA